MFAQIISFETIHNFYTILKYKNPIYSLNNESNSKYDKENFLTSFLDVNVLKQFEKTLLSAHTCMLDSFIDISRIQVLVEINIDCRLQTHCLFVNFLSVCVYVSIKVTES